MATKRSGVIRGVSQPIPIREMVKRILFGARLHSQALAARYNIPLHSLLTVARMTSGDDVVFGPSEVNENLHQLLEEYVEKNPDALTRDFWFDYKIFDMRYDPPLEIDKGKPKMRMSSMPWMSSEEQNYG